MDLCDKRVACEGSRAPLAETMRPRTLADVVGQRHLLDPGKVLCTAIEQDRVPSIILWGPPGSGKTTIAMVIAEMTRARFVPYSAVLGSVKDVRRIVSQAKDLKAAGKERTILFVDEIHRFNKAQQDAFLPSVEAGDITLFGATTENPSFAVISPLLSRSRVFSLDPLGEEDLLQLLYSALDDEKKGLGSLGLAIDDEAAKSVVSAARGDARQLYNILDLAARHAEETGASVITPDIIEEASQTRTILYDKAGEEHYNVISAFIKSMRGSDPDAAVYWMVRMMEAGEDPLFILRRMLIFASEDIGNADPHALMVANAADEAFRRVGLPEGRIIMSQAVVYLACAPKSNASYMALMNAQKDVNEKGALGVPLKLRNAPTKHMKKWGYGDGYRYPHSEGGHAAGETYLPDELEGRRYYFPTRRGIEARIDDRLKALRKDGSREDSAEVTDRVKKK